MHNIISLSGWGQSAEALFSYIPSLEGIQITTFDYSYYPNVNDVFEAFSPHPCDILIGWSLGAQLALRAVSEGALTPKAMILLAPPFQFLNSSSFSDGTSPTIFEQALANYQDNPQEMLLNFATLISLNDSKAKAILPILRKFITPEAPHWLYWLNELAHYSCTQLKADRIPFSFIVHGMNDQVTSFSQTEHFINLLPHTHREALTECGHAPHLHDPDLFIRTVLHAITL